MNGLKYKVMQVTLKEKLIGTGSNIATLSKLQNIINEQYDCGYKLHTITTSESFSKGLFGGDRIQATIIFEKIED